VEYIADSLRDPFGMNYPCEDAVPGFGPTDAHFHVVGDRPGVHGGVDTGIPFTDEPWSAAFFQALVRAGLVGAADLRAGEVDPASTFLSYLHACPTEGGAPTPDEYDAMEAFFDAELRAITAHVLLPVGQRATEHVLRTYTARPADGIAVADVHATEIRGSGWLVVPVKDPAEWGGEDADALVDALTALLSGDYRRVSDLGRFRPGSEPYLVR